MLGEVGMVGRDSEDEGAAGCPDSRLLLIQGYLAHKKQRPLRTLQQDYA